MAEFRGDWLNEIRNMQREMDRLLSHLGHTKPPEVYFAPRFWEPAIDVYETEEQIVVALELAGMDREKLEVVVESNTLVVRGERRETPPRERRSYHRMEIPKGAFERSIPLPEPVDPDQTRAVFEDGLLRIVLPKVQRGQTLEVRVRTII